MSSANPVICFYSFKGGAGRTVCTANFTSAFAKQRGVSKEAPVLVIDMDLDSAGLTIMMKGEDPIGKCTSAGLLSGASSMNLNQARLREEFFKTGLHDISERLYVSTGGVRFLATEVAPRKSVATEDDGAFYLQHLIGLSEDKGFRGVIIDSSSGRQDSAQVSQLAAHVVVCCCRMTDQFYYGTKKHLETFIANHSKNSSFPAILVVPVAVPTPSEGFEKSFRSSVRRLKQMVFDLQRYSVNIQLFNPGIGEVEKFKWEESVLSENEADPDAADAATRFKELAAKVRDMLPQDG